MDEVEVYLPFLADVVLHLGDMMFYTHVTVLASGARGSVFLGNIVALQRDKQEDQVLSLDISSLFPSPTATKALSSVLDYMYTGKVDFPVDSLASVLVSAYILRIQLLFGIARDKLLEVLGSGSVSSAIQVLSDAQRVPATEDTEELIAAIVKQAKQAVNATNVTSVPSSSSSKIRRRRASYKAAMSTVHNKTLGVRARVKDSAPGKLQQQQHESSQDDTKEKTMASNDAAERAEIQEHVVGSDHTPGKRIASSHKGRRFSFTVPKGAQPGDVLKVVVPKASFAKASSAAPPPPPPIEERKEDPTESLLWVYVDADDAQFGPFGRDMMRGWLMGGMIPMDLRVRPASREDLEFQPIDDIFGGSQPFFDMSSETME
jgi:hypothetical protein